MDPDSTEDSRVDNYMPTFYVGQHESKRALPISEIVLRQAQDVGYDMLTTPITTPHFHSRVLAMLSAHISELDSNVAAKSPSPAPIIPPFHSVDTPLTPGDSVSQLVGYSSAWIDLCSPDPLISNVSRQVLSMEIAYAAFCGVGNIIIPGPRQYSSGAADSDGLIQYARAVQEALNIASYVQMLIHVPMYQHSSFSKMEAIGDLAAFAREEFLGGPSDDTGKEIELYAVWDAWNLIRSVCKYSSRLSVALAIPPKLPSEALQSRWFAEPLRLLSFTASTFVKNVGGHPVLHKGHQNLFSRYMRLKQPPWLLLCDVGPIPIRDESGRLVPTADGFPSPSVVVDAYSPTLGEASDQLKKENHKSLGKTKDPVAHLTYIRWLQRRQPPRTIVERFGAGYQDYLQAPLQPLTDNLESVTYEVFEKDPIKYDWYEEAITKALVDWKQQQKPTSSSNGEVVIAVAGSGRGPLVTRAIKASAKACVSIQIWAVEKNPNAYVLLQRHNEEDWGSTVNVVKSDMRAWKGPLLLPDSSPDQTSSPHNDVPKYGKVDILVSELLGSFADNELSPECLDGVQHVLATPHGISIPSSYTAHVTPILAPRLHADLSHRAITDPTVMDTPYVVMLHAIDFLAVSVPNHHRVQEAWEFVHPQPASTLVISEARRGGGVSGGGGGTMAGGDGANEHNSRYSRLTFVCKDRSVVNGIAGYFESVLYDGGNGNMVELSTRPDTIDAKSKDMTSWFPIYFPLKNPVYVPDDAEVDVTMWRQTDDRKVWYEWLVEAFVMIGPSKRIRVGFSDVGTSRKMGCLM